MSISRNTTYNIIGTLLPVLVALLTIPIYVKLIGDQRYAVISISWLLLGYFGVFDFGIGKAAAQRISVLNTNVSKRSSSFWTALSLNTFFGILGGLIILPVAQFFFSEKFIVDPGLIPEILHALPWLVVAVPFATINSVLNGSLQAVEKFGYINIINSLGSILFQVLPLFVALKGILNLEVLLAVAIFARFSGLLLLFFVAIHFVSNKKIPVFDLNEAKKLFKFGGWIAVSSFISPIMVMADRFLIGSIISARAVTLYTVPYQLAERAALIPNALGMSLFPRFAKGAKHNAENLAIISISSLQFLMTTLILVAILNADLILSIWMSSEFSKESSLVLKIILVGFWINGLARVPLNLLQALGKPKIVAISHLLQVVPYFILLTLVLDIWGIEGAAFAFTARVFLDYVLLSWFSGILKNSFHSVAFGMFLLLAALIISLQDFSNLFFVVLSQSILILITIIWSYNIAPRLVKHKIKTFLNYII